MSLSSSKFSSVQSNMNFQHLSRELTHLESSPSSNSQRESRAFQFGFPAAMNAKPVCTGSDHEITNQQIFLKSPCSICSLPQKRSNPSLASERVGDLEASYSRAISGFYSAKRLKGSITPPLSSTFSSWDNSGVSTGISQPMLGFPQVKTVLPKRAQPAEATDDQLESDCGKTLQSPFEYTPELGTSHDKPTARNGIQLFDSRGSLRDGNSSAYIYFAPTNPCDKTNQALEAHPQVPRRQLSYGGPRDQPSKPGPRSLHKSTGSWELRCEAERHAKDCNLGYLSDKLLNASTARAYHSEPMRSKPRLWLDLSLQKDKIQKAVRILTL